MDPVIVDDFISADLSSLLCSFLDPLCKPTPRKSMLGVIGYATSAQAAAVGTTVRALEGYDGTEHEDTVHKIEELYSAVKSTLEAHFQIEMDLINCNYQMLLEGAENPMHSDSTKLDGSPWRDDGVKEELEFSALLYLNDFDRDFTGGEIYFPKQDVLIQPKRGKLVFFRGDVEHIHEVRKVTYGSRKNFVLFFARKGNVSDQQFFND